MTPRRAARIVASFMRGSSPVGLARGYGLTKRQVEAIIRRACRRARR